MKSVLARRRSMTSARITSGAKEHRHHVQPKTYRLGRRRNRGAKHLPHRHQQSYVTQASRPAFRHYHSTLAKSTRTIPDPVFDRAPSRNSTSQDTPLYNPASASESASI